MGRGARGREGEGSGLAGLSGLGVALALFFWLGGVLPLSFGSMGVSDPDPDPISRRSSAGDGLKTHCARDVTIKCSSVIFHFDRFIVYYSITPFIKSPRESDSTITLNVKKKLPWVTHLTSRHLHVS